METLEHKNQIQSRRSVKFKPGDMLYYADHRATGVLIEKNSEGEWRYSLRSPLVSDRGTIKVTISCTPESRIISAVKDGVLVYYEAR